MKTTASYSLPVNDHFHIYPLSEKAVTVELGDAIEEGILLRVTALNRLLQAYPFPGMLTTVPAYATVTIFFDPLQVIQSAQLPGDSCFEKVNAYLQQLQHTVVPDMDETAKEVMIPVHYGGGLGPDLEAVAQMHNLTTQEVIHLHSTAIYKVYMIGFVPGFAYLGGLPEQLFSPRKEVPRGRVPAGAVGIAGSQTGIYPIAIPGGWQLIGQTPLQIFNPHRKAPGLLNSGDIVRFQPISLTDYHSFIQPSL